MAPAASIVHIVLFDIFEQENIKLYRDRNDHSKKSILENYTSDIFEVTFGMKHMRIGLDKVEKSKKKS